MKPFLYLLVFALLLSFSGCAEIPDATTRVYVYDKVKSIQIGNSTQQVIYLLDGPPTHVTSMRKNGATFDLWEYKIGNFIYSQAPMILFRNGLVIALPKNGYELTQSLNQYQVIEDAQFWTNKDK